MSPHSDANAPALKKILRFRASERRVHWAIAIPFLVCYTTALILVVVYNPAPDRPFRDVFSWIHRASGICLIVFPTLMIARSTGSFLVHVHNIRQAWIWVLDDVKWLMLMGLSAMSRKVRLPPQGKFNAAQKLNFMMVMSTYPFYVLTGLAMWITGATLLSWFVHFGMAVLATPFILGHIFMATIPRSSRKALQGMISGYVEREWAKHHHQRWFQAQFEEGGSRKVHAALEPGRAERDSREDEHSSRVRPRSEFSPRPVSANRGGIRPAWVPFDTISERFERDPHGAVAALNRLRLDDPEVMRSFVCGLRDGRRETWLGFGLKVLDLAARQGYWGLSADLFEAVWPDIGELDLDRESAHRIIDRLLARGDLTTAARACAWQIQSDPDDDLAVHRLHQVGDEALGQIDSPG